MKTASAILIGITSLLLGFYLRTASSPSSKHEQEKVPAPIQPSSRERSSSPNQNRLKRTLQIPQSTQRWLQTIALLEKADLNDMQGIAQSIGFSDLRITQLVAQRWFELDPQHFFESSLAEMKQTAGKTASFACYHFLRFLAKEWPQHDIEAAFTAFAQPDPRGFLEDARDDFVNHLFTVDIDRALEACSVMNANFYNVAQNHLRQVAHEDPQNAAHILFRHFNPNNPSINHRRIPGRSLLKTLGEVWGQSDPLQGLAFAHSHQNNQGQYLRGEIITSWFMNDRNAATHWLEEQPAKIQEKHRPDLLKSWAADDPESAFTWFLENRQGSDNELHNMRWLLNGAIEKDVAEAAALIPRIEELDLPWNGVTEVTQKWFTPDEDLKIPTEAVDWLRSLGDSPIGKSVIKSAMERWSKTDPDSMKNYLEEERTFDYPPQAYEMLVKTLADRDPISALEWSAGLGDKSEDLLQTASEYWLTKRPEAAVNWLRNSPTNPQIEAALLDRLSLTTSHPREAEFIRPKLGPANLKWVQARFKEN